MCYLSLLHHHFSDAANGMRCLLLLLPLAGVQADAWSSCNCSRVRLLCQSWLVSQRQRFTRLHSLPSQLHCAAGGPAVHSLPTRVLNNAARVDKL
jgi:hypothetical protein